MSTRKRWTYGLRKKYGLLRGEGRASLRLVSWVDLSLAEAWADAEVRATDV